MALFKDEGNINRAKDQSDNIRALADAIKKDDLHAFLFRDEKGTDKPHNPNHTRCSFNSKTMNASSTTEKRMCRCMYHYNNEENEQQYKRCREKCRYTWKWELINGAQFTILDYEVPSSYVIKKVGGVDLIIKNSDNIYAVEVKPEDSNETIVRMIAEILTYVEDEKFKEYMPAICFFEGSKQYNQFTNLRNNEDLQYILKEKKIAVFCFSIKEHGKVNKFEIRKLEQLT